MAITPAATFVKDPSAVLDFAIDWATWLGSDTIATSTWSAPAGIAVDSSANSPTRATVWLSGGTAGNTYQLTNTIVTAGGRTDQRTIAIEVRDR